MFRRWRGLVQCNSWYIHVNVGDNFQMISFDFINSIFNCWFKFKVFCFDCAVNIKLTKNIIKGRSNFRNRLLWCKLDWYFIDHLSSFWDTWCFGVNRDQFFFKLFQFLMLLLHEIHKLFFWMFKMLIRFIKPGMYFFSMKSS